MSLFVGLVQEGHDFLPLAVVFRLEGARALARADAVLSGPGDSIIIVVGRLHVAEILRAAHGRLSLGSYRKVIIWPRVTFPVGPKWVESVPPVPPFSLAHSTAL